MIRKAIRKRQGPGWSETIVCVDPSIKTCGVAVFQRGVLKHHELVKPVEYKKEDEFMRADEVYGRVRLTYRQWKADRILIEVPAYWANEGFAARESGNLGKLHFLCGMLATIGPHILPSPHMWKGQMPKKVMRNRLWDVYDGVCGIDMATIDHNVLDAIGIGHWYLYGKV